MFSKCSAEQGALQNGSQQASECQIAAQHFLASRSVLRNLRVQWVQQDILLPTFVVSLWYNNVRKFKWWSANFCQTGP